MGAPTTTAREHAAAAGDTDAANRLRARQPARREMWLATDDDAVAAYQQLKRESAATRIGRDASAASAADKRLHEARQELEAIGAVRVVLRNVGRRRYRELGLSEICQPREQDHEDVRRATGNQNARFPYNLDEYPYRLVELCLVEPVGLTHADLKDMVEDGRLSEGELGKLVGAAQQLHDGDRVVDLGK